MVIADYREPIAIQNDFYPAPIRTILSFVFSENIAKSSLEFRCNFHLSRSDLYIKLCPPNSLLYPPKNAKLFFLLSIGSIDDTS